MKKSLIFNIQNFCINDGPGIRTTVFFKGCPLKCKWCHNPETIKPTPEILAYPEKCIGCNMCDKGCFSGARVVCGKEMTANELLNEILLDFPYYTNGGGVTFSGGEPLMQRYFIFEIINLCKDKGISVAIETSLIYFDEEIFSKLDFVMADLKIWDSQVHEEYTGVKNNVIKENFKRLDALGIPIIARTPIIPGINQEIDKISDFLKELKNVRKYELLPYHPLGLPKYEALGLKTPEFSVPTDDYMKELNKYAFDIR